MQEILERFKDLKTTVPGAVAGVWAVIDMLAEYGIQIVVGIGLLLSGGKRIPDNKGDSKGVE